MTRYLFILPLLGCSLLEKTQVDCRKVGYMNKLGTVYFENTKGDGMMVIRGKDLYLCPLDNESYEFNFGDSDAKKKKKGDKGGATGATGAATGTKTQ